MDGVVGILVAILCVICVVIIAGCGADLLINVLLTIWLWIPGLIHAFYLLFVYFDRREKYKMGHPPLQRAPFVFSNKIQSGGMTYGRF
ncbi:5372684d-94fe-4a69-9bb9-72c95e8081b4 [Thermothielavioides terrestris]|uniref:5372684d-94fe-4a69-9bb9-72c95e8081b4 n=1 Tax=Thermothielavioides terrestris TaxID=2587410 RepID=A0A3S5CWP7_9PEZI|nr:5372684d-94fe-4a69-9bb9-72c95e8081b4 [Thermothielavioides terrestris]